MPFPEPEPELVSAARRGSLSAFERLVRLYQGEVYRLAFSLVRDAALAEDVTQDAFVRAFRFLPRYRGDSKFSTWLFSIARNCALDELRRSARRRKTWTEVASQPRLSGGDHTLRIEVREALGKLPLDLREPLIFIDMLGASYAEVASTLNVPLGTVKSRVYRARHELARVLELPEENAHES